jgi:hypothetical protein
MWISDWLSLIVQGVAENKEFEARKPKRCGTLMCVTSVRCWRFMPLWYSTRRLTMEIVLASALSLSSIYLYFVWRINVIPEEPDVARLSLKTQISTDNCFDAALVVKQSETIIQGKYDHIRKPEA